MSRRFIASDAREEDLYHMPFKTESFDNVLHAIHHPMRFPRNLLVPFHRRAFGAVKYEER